MKKSLFIAVALCVTALIAAEAAYAASGKDRSGSFVSRDGGKSSSMMSFNRDHGKIVTRDHGKKHDDRIHGKPDGREEHKRDARDKKDDDRHYAQMGKFEDKKDDKRAHHNAGRHDNKRDDRPFRFTDYD